MKSKLIWIALLLVGSTAELRAAPVAVQLDKPRVQLWYEGSGRLSEDIAPPKSITLWNTIIGEGGAEENANDALLTVQVRTHGQQNLDRALVLTASDANGKVIAQRTFKGILTSRQGQAVMPLWVRNIGCAGTVVFLAAIGNERQSFSIDFACGE